MDKQLSNGAVIKGKKECCTATNVLWYLVFTGFAVNYMIRINLNIAIVSMVTARQQTNVSLTSECLTKKYSFNETLDHQFEDTNNNSGITEHSTISSLVINSTENVIPNQPHTFPWDEQEQSNVLGAFFWLHWLTQIPGGVLGSKYGAKLVFGLSNFLGVICAFFIPMAAFMGSKYLICLRILQGLICGFAWPAMHNMTARWIPPNERSKFVTAYLGSSVGAALTYPVCGFIIENWGWELVFYTSGAMGTLWFTAWWFLVYDNPAQHPRISNNEKEYILESLGQTYSKEKAPVPWRHILTSPPVWMNILAQWGGLWGLFTLMTHTPTYFKFIHGWNIRATGLLSGMPHVLRMCWAYVCSLVGDYLLKTNKMTRTNVRKLATAGCTIGQGIFMLGLAYSGCNRHLALFFLTASITMNGSVSTGPLACIVDISPNYASVVLGIVNSVVAVVGFLTPMVVGFLTVDNQTTEQWQKIFWISSFMLMSCGIIYVAFANTDLQPWNSPDFHEGSELTAMKTKEENEGNKGSETKAGYQIVATNETKPST